MKNVINRASIGAKKNLSNRAFELGKAKELRSVVAHTMRLAMLVVLLLTFGVGKMWGNTVILPAGNSTYTRGNWKASGAPTSYTSGQTYSIKVGGGQCMPVTLTKAADQYNPSYDNSGWLQLKKSSEGVLSMVINSTNGVNVSVKYASESTFTMTLTNSPSDASGITANLDGEFTGKESFSTATINTFATEATLEITAGTKVLYISTITIEAKSNGTITTSPLTYNISYDTDGSSGCSVSGPATATAGSTVNFTITPASGYSSDGTLVYDDSYEIMYESLDPGVSTFTMPECDVNVYASFTSCTSRTLSFTNGTSAKTLNKVDNGGMTYTNTATKSTGTGTISYGISNVNPTGCASVNSSGVVTFSEYGSATITASLGADGDYCAASDISYNISMSCKSRTNAVTFASSTPSVAVTTNTYQQTASVGTGSGTITYALNQTSGSGWTINTSNGTVSFNGNAGTGTITATAAEDNAGYCEESGSYTLTVTSVVPTVSTFTPGSTENSITMTGSQVTNKGGSAITRYGYIYSTTLSTAATLIYGASGATDANVGTNDIALNTGFDKTVTGLSSGNTYYVRAYATNAAGTGYSDIQTISTVTYGDYVFSCAELELTGPTGDLVFVTSTAGKMVRSQEAFHLTGSALTPSTAFTFSFGNDGLNALFDFKLADGGTIQTDASGNIDEDIYVFYTPSGTTDGLDKATNLTATMSGTKPRTAILNTKTIIGRHLPAQFVIAGKKDNKWWALPSNMANTSTPAPVEIAVNDMNNPSLAYTAASNIYGLEEQHANNVSAGNGQYVRLTMSITDGAAENPGPAPLFGSGSTAPIGKSGTSHSTSELGAGYWWKLAQTNTNTNMTNPQEAKYNIYCANNTTNHLRIKDNNGSPEWGLYDSGVEELRLIPASVTPNIVAKVVEWGQHAAILEAAPTKNSVTATSVVGTLNEVSSSAITLSQTLTSVKGSSTQYNFTVNFGNTIDFAAAASNGALLLLEWKNGETVVGVSNIVVPKIIAASASMSSLIDSDDPWKTEVHVLPNVTLTADAGSFSSGDVRINQLEIYPKATVKVTTGTLEVASLVLRNGWTRAGSKSYDVARVYVASTAYMTKSNQTENWYVDWYIDYDQYYPIAVPFPVSITDKPYKNATGLSYNGNLILRYYDGENRAGVSENPTTGSNWKKYGETGNESYPRTLVPGKGYAMSAKRPTGRAFSIIRMPMTYTKPADMNPWLALGEQGSATITGGLTHKDQVQVTGWGKGTAQWYAMGWNFIGNPYMSVFNGDDEGISGKIEEQDGKGVRYATIPDVYFENFDQVVIAQANLKPASGFFIQANSTDAQTLTFSKSKIVPPSAAPRYMKLDESVPEQEAYIRLEYEGGKDQMGLIIGDDYTEAYEPDADLAKILGEGNYVKTYMHYSDMDLAYVAINETLAKNWIPVTVKIPAAGEYTFSLMNSSSVEALEGLYLIDYANGDKVTNLIEESYTFSEVAGTFAERFAINAIYGARQTPTGADVVSDGTINSDEPIKFLYREKVYILYHGVIYDATGKKVREINK